MTDRERTLRAKIAAIARRQRRLGLGCQTEVRALRAELGAIEDAQEQDFEGTAAEFRRWLADQLS